MGFDFIKGDPGTCSIRNFYPESAVSSILRGKSQLFTCSNFYASEQKKMRENFTSCRGAPDGHRVFVNNNNNNNNNNNTRIYIAPFL